MTHTWGQVLQSWESGNPLTPPKPGNYLWQTSPLIGGYPDTSYRHEWLLEPSFPTVADGTAFKEHLANKRVATMFPSRSAGTKLIIPIVPKRVNPATIATFSATASSKINTRRMGEFSIRRTTLYKFAWFGSTIYVLSSEFTTYL